MQSFQQRHQGTYSSCSPGCLRIRHYAMYPTVRHISTYHRQLRILSKTASAKSDILPMRILALGYFSFMGNYLFHLFCRWRPALSPACTNVSHDLRFHPSGGNIPPPYPENMVNTLEPSGPSHQNKVGTFTTRLVGLEPK